MTPIQIEVLLKFWYLSDPSKEPWSPAQKDFISNLLVKGVLYTSIAGQTEANREALEPYIDAICAVPLPERKWAMPLVDKVVDIDEVRVEVYPKAVKETAYKMDPDCWVSYSGKPRRFKQKMEIRRQAALDRALDKYLEDGGL